MKIMIESMLIDAAKDIVDSAHKLVQFNIEDMEYMPYDVHDMSVVADWLYALSVDHDADLVIVNSASLRDKLTSLGIKTMRIE